MSEESLEREIDVVDEIEEIDENSPCIIVHGGVEESEESPLLIERITSCQKAACIGYNIMKNGGSSLDAVEAALRWLEDDEIFNCGYGSALNQFCEVQMDASIMDGGTRTIGSVVAVSDLDHPISVARRALERHPNSILCGEAVARLAHELDDVVAVSKGNMVSPAAYASCVSAGSGCFGVQPGDNDYAGVFERDNNGNCNKETVGCVAWDGVNMVSGSTTGGLNRKRPGRVGDSGLLGCGVYADPNFGCNVTGHGESAIRLNLARRFAERAAEENASIDEILGCGLQEMLECTGQRAGAVGLMKDGRWASMHCGTRMPFAYVRDGEVVSGGDPQPKVGSSRSSECTGGSSSCRPCSCSSTAESKA